MTSSRIGAAFALLGGCVLLVVAVVYAAEPAHALPSFFPGHAGGGSSEYGHHHLKHAIAAFAVALAAFAYAWFATGPKANAATTPS
ncbi:MAG TPA: hypothetical protein VFB41_01980 [Solirubrobacteraceae bacterium]|nr:hypothetical protein [Solirubrobacteraceae bacterium]